mmetsp:Transcript_52017/g.144070  ORF Transcript_52017/g.144070 Transcript_52017/m.144070 type:complete len:227 (+) Transcript_52017:143-823(+)
MPCLMTRRASGPTSTAALGFVQAGCVTASFAGSASAPPGAGPPPPCLRTRAPLAPGRVRAASGHDHVPLPGGRPRPDRQALEETMAPWRRAAPQHRCGSSAADRSPLADAAAGLRADWNRRRRHLAGRPGPRAAAAALPHSVAPSLCRLFGGGRGILAVGAAGARRALEAPCDCRGLGGARAPPPLCIATPARARACAPASATRRRKHRIERATVPSPILRAFSAL